MREKKGLPSSRVSKELELGVGEDKVTLQKPEAAEANASGSDAAARRVEVRLQ